MFLPITPVHRTDADGQAWVFIEAYGLSAAGAYAVEISLEPAAGGDVFSLTYRGAPPPSLDATVTRLLRLDLSDTRPGEYTVRFSIVDGDGRRSLPLEASLRVR
jgi:hypothetical protein